MSAVNGLSATLGPHVPVLKYNRTINCKMLEFEHVNPMLKFHRLGSNVSVNGYTY